MNLNFDSGLFSDSLTARIDIMKVVMDDPLLKQTSSAALDCLFECFKNGKTLYVAGNGGSAADAQHFVAELVAYYSSYKQKPLSTHCLNTNISIITSITNDVSYDDIFSRQLLASAKQGDVFIGLTTSGNSSNIIKAFNEAQKIGITTIAFYGKDGGLLNDIKLDHKLHVKCDDTGIIQQVHMNILHSFCGMLSSIR